MAAPIAQLDGDGGAGTWRAPKRKRAAGPATVLVAVAQENGSVWDYCIVGHCRFTSISAWDPLTKPAELDTITEAVASVHYQRQHYNVRLPREGFA